jgi:multiple sugar transport system permease protein
MNTKWYYRVLVYVILVTAVLITFGPFYWMIVSSIRPESMIFSSKLNLLPKPLTFKNYGRLFSRTLFPRWLLNSTIVATVTTAMALFFSSLAGFAFAKYEFWGKNVLFMIVDFLPKWFPPLV